MAHAEIRKKETIHLTKLPHAKLFFKDSRNRKSIEIDCKVLRAGEYEGSIMTWLVMTRAATTEVSKFLECPAFLQYRNDKYGHAQMVAKIIALDNELADIVVVKESPLLAAHFEPGSLK